MFIKSLPATLLPHSSEMILVYKLVSKVVYILTTISKGTPRHYWLNYKEDPGYPWCELPRHKKATAIISLGQTDFIRAHLFTSVYRSPTAR